MQTGTIPMRWYDMKNCMQKSAAFHIPLKTASPGKSSKNEMNEKQQDQRGSEVIYYKQQD